MPPTNNPEPRYLSVPAAAAYLSMTESSLRYKIQARRVPFSKLGKSIRIDRIALDKLLERTSVTTVDVNPRRLR